MKNSPRRTQWTQRNLFFLWFLSVLCGGAFLHAQLQHIKAEVTPLLEADAAHAGDTLRGALTVSLPERFHVQSNKPRDTDLIPTELTVDTPMGVTVKEVVFPAPIDLKQVGVNQPLAVFERTFSIGVQLALASTVPVGTLEVPVRLRYQACDDTTCFAPTTASATWTVKVVPAGAAVHPTHRDVIDRITFGHGDVSGTVIAPPAPNRVNLQNPENPANLDVTMSAERRADTRARLSF